MSNNGSLRYRDDSLLPNDHVRIIVPDNQYVHNHIGIVKQLTNYGAIISWNGGSGEFRLFNHEMVKVSQLYTGNVCQRCQSINVVRAGTCLLCRDCGDTSGGCG